MMRRPLQGLARLRRRIASWRPGIAWQLGVAFLGVAALAAVANFAVQRTISITTTRVVAAPATEVLSGPPASIARPGALGAPGQTALQRMVEGIEGAYWARKPPPLDGVHRAAAELRATLLLRHGPDSAAQVDAAHRRGLGAIDAAAHRRTAFDAYAALLGSTSENLQQTLDGAWKIFGRVVARQSLVNLNGHLERLRRQAELVRDGSSTPMESGELHRLEETVATALVQDERSLRRSLGAETYERVVADVARMKTLRQRLVDVDHQRITSFARFRSDAGALRTLLQKPPDLFIPAPAAQPSLLLARPNVTAPVPPLLLQTPPWEAPAAVTTQSQAREEGVGRGGLALLSMAVLAILLAVSVGTVRSILRPVQRLIAASQRIASGESHVRVPRAGSREFDRLAAAFNRMAADLETAQAAARDHQQALEARVIERTRQLQHLAGHDALTQLPNRRQLFDRLRTLLASGQGRCGSAALFFLDLDNFKNINDGMGHGFGDQVLMAIAARLRDTVGSRGFAARFGGDEFTVVVADTGAAGLQALGRDLVGAVQQPLQLEGREVQVSASIGAASAPDHADNAESLLRAADAALFRAKALGRNQLVVFTPELIEQAASRFATEQGLRQAVDRGELQLVFQPEVDLRTMEVEVVEALLRWRTADGRVIPPDQFLSIAEDSGLIVGISDWVMRTAIAAAARWRTAGMPAVRVAVNVSPRELRDPAFPDRIAALLHEHGLPAELLEIELTETVLQTGTRIIESLRRLRQLGVAIALDDFGTGYSSLASLEQLPLDRVKLDRSLVAGIDSSPRAAAIANAIIQLGRDIGLRITAEGVERRSQLAALRDSGVVLQGFLLSMPLGEAELAAAVRRLPEMLQSLLLDIPATHPPASRPGLATVIDISDTQRRRRPVR